LIKTTIKNNIIKKEITENPSNGDHVKKA